MPTAQNVFPKSGNDPIYFTEINRFATAGRILGSSFFSIGSADAVQDLGSFLIAGGTLSQPSVVDMFYTIYSGNVTTNVRVSGLGGHGSAVLAAANTAPVGNAHVVIGSPLITPILLWQAQANQAGMIGGGGTLTNLDPGSPVVIFLRGQAAAGGSGLMIVWAKGGIY